MLRASCFEGVMTQKRTYYYCDCCQGYDSALIRIQGRNLWVIFLSPTPFQNCRVYATSSQCWSCCLSQGRSPAVSKQLQMCYFLEWVCWERCESPAHFLEWVCWERCESPASLLGPEWFLCCWKLSYSCSYGNPTACASQNMFCATGRTLRFLFRNALLILLWMYTPTFISNA